MQIDKRKDRIPKQTKVVTTVEKLLTNEDVKDVLEEICAARLDIEAMIVIRQNRDGTTTWHITSNMTSANIVYLLERVKTLTLQMDEGENDESQSQSI